MAMTDGGVDAETPAELVELWRRQADNYPRGEMEGEAARAAVEACADELEAVLSDNDNTDDWDPEPAELREGETRDDRSHAARNAEQLEMADGTGGDGDA